MKKLFLIVCFISGCASTNVADYSVVKLTTFDKENYHEYVVGFKALEQDEKVYVNYFEDKIFAELKDKKVESCNKVLSDDQKHYAAKWWALQGWMSIDNENKAKFRIVAMLFQAFGVQPTDFMDQVYEIVSLNYYSKFKFDMCASNATIEVGK